MNYLFFSDLHIIESELEEIYSIFEELSILIDKYNITHIFNCGDTFDKIYPTILELKFFAEWLKKINKPMTIIAANSHESISQTLSIVDLFGILKDNINVVKEYQDENKLFCGHFILQQSKQQGGTVDAKTLKKYRWAVLGHCVSEDTEILTEQGWKTHNNLLISDRIATYNLKQNKIEYQFLLNIHKYYYEGELINFIHKKHAKLDCLVTPNHKVVIKNKNFYSEAQLKCAYQINEGSFLLNSPNWDYRIDFSFSNPELAKLIGWIIGDGGLIKSKKIYGIRLSQKKGSKSQAIKKLLNRCNIKFTMHKRDSNMDCYYIGKQNKFLIDFFNNYCPDKKLNRLLISLPKKELQLLYEGLILSDGCKQKGNIQIFYQKDYSEILLFEELCLRLGRKFYTTKSKSGFKPDSSNYCVIVSNTLTSWISRQQGNIIKQNYRGIVWCPETPNGTWIAKRKGSAFITGNSHNFESIKPNAIQLGSVRRVCFRDDPNSPNTIAICKNYESDFPEWEFITLNSPYKMIDITLNSNNLQEKDLKNNGLNAPQGDILPQKQEIGNRSNESKSSISQAQNLPKTYTFESICQLTSFLDKTNPKTKIRVTYKSYNEWREFLEYSNSYKNKFFLWVEKKDFLISDNVIVAKNENKSLITALKEWMEKNKTPKEIQEVLLEEIK